MEDRKNWMRIEFPSLSENARFARTTVAVFASQLEFTLEEIEDIKDSVDEAVTNSIVHGYQNEPELIIVEASHDGKTLTIIIEDFGKGFSPDEDEESEPETKMDHLGSGILWMKECMDKVEIISEKEKGTKVIMEKTPKTAMY
ncbi:MAG: anti-sigma F factor [Firmicutes bacterium]|nr:anti-sigma F factor [Bacillota bacterium]